MKKLTYCILMFLMLQINSMDYRLKGKEEEKPTMLEDIPLITKELYIYGKKKLPDQCNTNFWNLKSAIINTFRYPINILKLLEICKDDFIFKTNFREEDKSSRSNIFFGKDLQRAVIYGVISYFIFTKREEWYEKLRNMFPKFLNYSVFINNKFFVRDILFYHFTVGQLVNIANNNLEDINKS